MRTTLAVGDGNGREKWLGCGRKPPPVDERRKEVRALGWPWGLTTLALQQSLGAFTGSLLTAGQTPSMPGPLPVNDGLSLSGQIRQVVPAQQQAD